MLVTELARKLSIYTESATGHPQQDADVADSWRQICEIEAKWVSISFRIVLELGSMQSLTFVFD